MNTELKNAVNATDKDAQYDTSAKRLLGQKSILAHILVKTVDSPNNLPTPSFPDACHPTYQNAG